MARCGAIEARFTDLHGNKSEAGGIFFANDDLYSRRQAVILGDAQALAKVAKRAAFVPGFDFVRDFQIAIIVLVTGDFK